MIGFLLAHAIALGPQRKHTGEKKTIFPSILKIKNKKKILLSCPTPLKFSVLSKRRKKK